jgi:predicted Rossmann-fold nucleotide-binding protein
MNKQYKIGIFGSAGGDYNSSIAVARELGKVLTQINCIVVTGAAGGLPNEVAVAAHKNSVSIWGYSPSENSEKQKLLIPDADLSIYAKISYTPKSFVDNHTPMACKKYRNVLSTEVCDAGIIISGRWGTMNEFTNLYDMGKVIGILTGTGGIADTLDYVCKRINKKTGADVIFESYPQKLVNKIIELLDSREL